MFETVLAEYNSDLNAVDEWVQSIWEPLFSPCFEEATTLYGKLKNLDTKISDADLERILTILPLDLFRAAEILNNVRLKAETIKLKNKDKESELLRKPHDAPSAEWKRFVDDTMSEYRLLAAAYDAIIKRAENQMTFCKELIMSAKKLYDGRRSSEHSNPVSEVDPQNTDLPPYGVKPNTYVK